MERMEQVSRPAFVNFLDVLCNFPGDERIYHYARHTFITANEDRGLFASYLGTLGDPRALDVLRQALDWEDIDYLDYSEIRAAIEDLGEEVSHQRNFEGDSYYEALKRIDEEAEAEDFTEDDLLAMKHSHVHTEDCDCAHQPKKRPPFR